MITYSQYVRDCAVSKEVIDVFLDNSKPTWAQFDSEVGYKLGNSLPRDGLDDCLTISTVQENRARKSHGGIQMISKSFGVRNVAASAVLSIACFVDDSDR